MCHSTEFKKLMGLEEKLVKSDAELAIVTNELQAKEKEVREMFTILEEDSPFMGWQKMLRMASLATWQKEHMDEKRNVQFQKPHYP